MALGFVWQILQVEVVAVGVGLYHALLVVSFCVGAADKRQCQGLQCSVLRPTFGVVVLAVQK